MHHHVRRRSGHSSTTDVRRIPSEHITKHCKSSSKDIRKLGKSSREREGQIPDDEWNAAEPESFPQFCMSCEKQFFDINERELYCSPECRTSDETLSASRAPPINYTDYSRSFPTTITYPTTHHPREPFRDIIPRASPSRPTSTYFSAFPPMSPSENFQGLSGGDSGGSAAADYQQHYSSAVSALQSLSIRPPSPYSPTDSRSGFWPFGGRGGLSSTYDYSESGRQDGSYGYYGAASIGGERERKTYKDRVDMLR